MSNEKIVIGTWPLSGDFGKVAAADAEKVLKTCVESGFSEFDTAPNYGKGSAEMLLGKVLAKTSVRINTKFGNSSTGVKNFEISSLEASVDDSLKRLKREQIHILFLHNPRSEVKSYDAIISLLEKLKKSGKIAKSGISLAKNFLYFDEVLNSFDVVQEDFNLLKMDFFDLHPKFNRAFYARSPLASGILSGTLSEATKFAQDDHRSGWLKGERLSSILKRVRVLEKISPMPLPQLARALLLSDLRVNYAIFGVKRLEHVLELNRDSNLPKLSAEVVSKLKMLFDSDFGLSGEKSQSF